MEEVDKEISEMKLSLNARARVVAESYLSAVSLSILICLHDSDMLLFSSTHEHARWMHQYRSSINVL